MKNYLLSLLKFNIWANRHITAFITEAGEEASLSVQTSSFTTIRATLFHIWDAEILWFKRLHGESLTEGPSSTFSGTTAAGCKLVIEGSESLLRYLESLSESDLMRAIEYKNTKGVAFQNTIVEILAHVVNHSTFHRGQLVTMLRVAGFNALQSTDLVTFFRQNQ